MAPRLPDIFPEPDVLLDLPPEELAGFLLTYLSALPPNDQYLTFGSLTLNTGPFGEYAGPSATRFNAVAAAVAEAWAWLMREGLIAWRPGSVPLGQVFVTRRGQQYRTPADLAAYRRAGVLHDELLDPALAAKVVNSFRQGDYETAVFSAFKAVEVRVREVAGLPESLFGIALMQQAFRVDAPPGPLTDRARDRGEQVAVLNTFAGAVGLFRNPSGHRNVDYSPTEAAALIHFANYLLSIVENRRPQPPT